jgi:hypothetical protein
MPRKLLQTQNNDPVNASFLTLENIQWWLYVSMTYLPPLNQRLFFLPCAGAFKTRGAHGGRKFISESTSHQFLKAIREDPLNEKVILSEPCTVIPYRLEADPLRPDYNLPIEFLSVQGEFIFIDRLSHFLLKIKQAQPTRQVVFYFGGSHHYFILHYANLLAGSPFEVVYHVPLNGTKDYAKGSQLFMAQVRAMEAAGVYTIPMPLSIEKELAKRAGRYTHKPFLLALIDAQHIGHCKTAIKETRVEVTPWSAFQTGFAQVYGQIR